VLLGVNGGGVHTSRLLPGAVTRQAGQGSANGLKLAVEENPLVALAQIYKHISIEYVEDATHRAAVTPLWFYIWERLS
jgi:hypothetical protein